MVIGWNKWIFILSFSFVFCSIETSLTYVLKKMKYLFVYLYLFPRAVTPQIERMVGQIRERTRQKLKDFKDYLSVKAQRNITMTSYPYIYNIKIIKGSSDPSVFFLTANKFPSFIFSKSWFYEDQTCADDKAN